MKVLLVSIIFLAAFALLPPEAKAVSQSRSDLTRTTSITADVASKKSITAYTLSPELSEKARAHGRFGFRFAVIAFLYQLFTFWVVLRSGLAASIRDLAERVSGKNGAQVVVFGPAFVLVLGILGLPADIYQHLESRKYGLSIQGWSSWLGDWTKEQLLTVLLGTVLVSILFWVIRRSPQRWWLYFWLASLPILTAVIFVEPLVVDPLFHQFEPLQNEDAALTLRLQEMVRRSGQDIPPERMFWMGAGDQTTTLNAYVTGLGASKRIVVWDTTIAKMSTSQIVFVAGHEMGHYVLGHIWKGLLGMSILFLGLFYLGFRSINVLLHRYGDRWRVRSLDDWASLPALLLLIAAFTMLATPLMNVLSRYTEHQADQYGLEVTHGLTPDSGQQAAQAFQTLGELALAEVDPNPINTWFFFSHPSIASRVRFALTYDPWSEGQAGEFVK